jgi:hypothetical protein
MKKKQNAQIFTSHYIIINISSLLSSDSERCFANRLVDGASVHAIAKRGETQNARAMRLEIKLQRTAVQIVKVHITIGGGRDQRIGLQYQICEAPK